MVSNIVVKILNKSLGSFIDNLKSDQLNISLFSGTVKLENVSIKKTVLDNFPFPFRLEHGFVGKIFVDVPIRNIGSSPVKIEVKDVFVLLKLKEKDKWSESFEEKAFQDAKKTDLDSYEDIEESAREMKQQDPGYFSKLVAKIIDNLQITVENVYVRLEDDISFPAKPFACGIALKKVSAITTDEDWNFKYIENADEIHKAACLRNLSFFFDYNDNKSDVFIALIRDDPSLKAFSEFALLECNRSRSNRYVLNRLNMDLRIILNKDPKKNGKPQLRVELKIGGGFEQPPNSELGAEIGHMEFNVETQQITIGMKLIEYAGMYSKFQAGVLSKYQSRRFTKEQRGAYTDVYISYLTAIRKKQEKAILIKREELEKLEKEYSLDEIKKIRIGTRKALELDEKHEVMKMETAKKVKELESSKSSSVSSFKLFFGSSSAKEKLKQAKEEVEKYKQELSIEQEKQIKQEKMQLEKELKELFDSSEEVNLQTALDLPDDFIRFKFSIEINEISIAISEGTTFYRSNKLVELSIKGVDTDLSLSKQAQKIGFFIHSIDIMDYISKNKDFNHLLESHLSPEEETHHCLSVRFINDSTNPKSDLSLFVSNNCQLVLYANFHTIFTVASKLTQAAIKEEVDINYYKDFAQAALTKIEEYIQLGIVYAKDIYSNAVSKHFNVNLSVSLMAPLVIVPLDSSSCDNSSSLIADLGKIQMRSVVQRKIPERNYLEETRPEILYDYYELMLKKVQLFRQDKIDPSFNTYFDKHIYIRDLSLQIRLYNCLEPRHKNAPSIKIGGILNRLDIVLTDCNIVFLLRLLENMQKEQLLLEEVVSNERANSFKRQLSSLKQDIAVSRQGSVISGEITKETRIVCEEKMTDTKYSLNLLKKTQEFMIHFDDINLDIGRTIKEEEHYKPYAFYSEEMRKQYPGEAPYVTDIKLGINGFGGYGFMTIGGKISAQIQLFRMYMKDMQFLPIQISDPPVLKKMVDSNFEYILQNPKVEILKTRRVGDNYAAFSENGVFFEGLVNSTPFKEEINQIGIGVDVNLLERKANVDVNIHDIVVTLPTESLRPLFYMLSVINSVLPETPPPLERHVSDMKLPKISCDFSLHCGLNDLTIKLPINCQINNTIIYIFSVSASLDVKIHSVMEGSSLLTQEMQILGQIDKLGTFSQDLRNKHKWTIIPSTELQIGVHTSSNSVEELVEVTANVFPIDLIVGFKDIQALLEFAENVQSSIGKYLEAMNKSSKQQVEILSYVPSQSILIISAKVQKLRFMAINDRGVEEYPFAKFWLTNLEAKLNQKNEQNISVTLQELCCELSKPYDPNLIEYTQFFEEKKVKYTSLVKFGMDSIVCNMEILTDNNMTIKLNLHRLYMKDNQILPIKISDSKYSYNSLLVPEFQYLIHNPQIEADKFSSKGQLDVFMNINEENLSIDFLFSDFIIVLAMPTIRELILQAAELMHSLQGLDSKLINFSQSEPAPMASNNKSSISMNLTGKLENIELWIPEDALKSDKMVTKLALSDQIELKQGVNKEEKGIINVKTKVSNFSLSLLEKNVSRSLLKKFEIDFEYEEVAVEQQSMGVKIKPIEMNVSLTQVIFFQKFVDHLLHEIDSLPLETFLPKQEAPVLERKSIATLMSIQVQLDLVKLVIENDLVEYKYPLLKIWLANACAEMQMKPDGDQIIKTKIFDISLELGKMLNPHQLKYHNYRNYFKELLKTSRGKYMSEDCLYKEVLGLGINGLDFKLDKDNSDNMTLEAKLWRLFIKDRQIKPEPNTSEYLPILAPSYQSIISNPQIEELCTPLEIIQDPIEKEKEMRLILAEKNKSQFHVSIKLKANNKDIYANLEEFRVIFAAKTIASLSKMLKTINNLVEKIVPQLILEKECPREKTITPPKTTLSTEKDSEVNIDFKLRNVNILLPESGKDEMEYVAKFSLTAGMQLNMSNKAGNSKLLLNAEIESILLQYLKNDTILDTIIPFTKVIFQINDSTEGNSQDSTIIVNVYPVEIDLAFRHIQFFTKTSSRIIRMLPKLTGSPPQSLPSANALQNIMNIKASLNVFKMNIYDDMGVKKYPWVKLKLLNAAAGIEIMDFSGGGQKIMEASIESLSLEIYKKIEVSSEPQYSSFIEEFKRSHDSAILPYVKLLTLGFEKMKSDIKVDSGENIILDGYLHRLFLKDSQIKPQEELGEIKFVPAIASDFQDIISNPFIEESVKCGSHKIKSDDLNENISSDIKNNTHDNEYTKIDSDKKLDSHYKHDADETYSLDKNEKLDSEKRNSYKHLNDKCGDDRFDSEKKLHQLVVHLELLKRTEETNIKFHYSDFRIILAIPALRGVIETINISLIQMDQIMKIIGPTQPEVARPLPPASVSSKITFSGEIANIEMWIPQSTEINKSRICQLSFSSQIGFSSTITPESKITFITSKISQFALVVINKNLIEEGHSLSEAPFEQIIEPAQLSAEVRIYEMDDTQKTTIVVFVDPITMKLGFKNIHFLTDLANYYQEALAKTLPDMANKSTQPEATAIIPIKVTKVDLKIDPLTLSLIDETGLSRQQLFKILFSQIALSLTGTQLLDESRRSSLHVNRDLFNLHAGLVVEANFFNSIVSEYEPIIENWGLDCEILQENLDNKKQINICAPKMLNINCSQALAQTASVALKKFYDKTTLGQKEKRKISRAESMKMNSLMSEYIFTEGFIFENKLGYPIKFFIQTISGEREPREEYEKFEIPTGELLFLSKIKLKEIKNKQANTFFKNNINLVHEDTLRISVIVNDWKFSTGIPIELARPHSCVIREKIREYKKQPNKLPIVIRVRGINMHKIVSFESTILISNNTVYDIIVYSQDPYKKEISDSDTLKIKGGYTENLPFPWYCSNYCLGIFCKKKEVLIPFRVFDRLKSVFEIAIGNKELISRIIPYFNGEEYITCDVAAFKCNKIGTLSPVQYLISLNPPLQIQNSLPFPLQIFRTVKQEPRQLISNIKPQETLAVYSLDGNNLKDNRLTFQINMPDTHSYICETFQKQFKPEELSEEQLKFSLFENNKRVAKKKGIMDELIIQGNFRPYNQLSNRYENFELREKLFEHSHSKKLVLFAKQVIVNKTEFEIKVKGDKIPVYKIKPHSSRLFGIPQGVKVAFSTQGYNWCLPMEVTTVGITGAFTLQFKGKKVGYSAQTLDFGIKIAPSERPYTLTSVITIVPRYIFVNNLSIPISFAQYNQKLQRVTLLPKESTCFNFFKAMEASERKIVIFDGPTFPEEKLDKCSKSQPFPIDDLDDFQVPYRAERVNAEEVTWCDPKKDNNMKRTIQVSINSQDDATLFITFSKPKYSDYNIRNLSSEIVKISVKETKEELLLINPGEILPLIWPDFTIPNKEIVIQIGDIKKSYDITFIGKQKIMKGSRMYYHVRTIARNFGREMLIKESLSREYSGLSYTEKTIISKKETKSIQNSGTLSNDGMNLTIEMLGIGISVIDERPAELLYISFTDLKINIEQQFNNNRNVKEKNTILGLNIGYIQIDNMLEKSYPVIFGPQRLFEKNKEKRTKEDWEPLVQIQCSGSNK